jgi:hypothetical protein
VRRVAVLVVALGACVLPLGRGGDSNSAQAAVKRALARTVDARSSRFTISLSAPEFLAQPFPASQVDGVMDYTRQRGRITYGPYTDVIFDGETTYMRWPMPWRTDKAWLRYDTDRQEEDPLDLQERAMSHPIGLLRFLTGASSDVREVGNDDVRGTSTRHYEGTLDLQKVVDQAPPEKRADLQDMLDFMHEYEPTTVPFGLWVDAEGVAHRLRIDSTDGASLLIEYYDFGVPVEITPPPANEIMSQEDFWKEIEQHAGDSTCGENEAGSGGSITGPSSDTSGSASDDSGTSLYEVCTTIGGG